MIRLNKGLKLVVKAGFWLIAVYALMGIYRKSADDLFLNNKKTQRAFSAVSADGTVVNGSNTQHKTSDHESITYVSRTRIKSNYSSLYHVYENKVDLRIIVLTYNRAASLKKTLSSLRDLITDGDAVSLEIWIDKSANATIGVNPDTVRTAQDFRWKNGPVTVWIHTRHVGIIGQWVYTWRPNEDDPKEWALFIEDDIDISRYGHRWLRAVRRKFGQRPDLACYTLQDENAIGSYGMYRNTEIRKPASSPIFLHRLPGSWAMFPRPVAWRQFQDWFEEKRKDPNFRPYVKEAALQTEWYKAFERQGRADTMWTMWYIYYTYQTNQLCLYANLPTYTGRRNTSLAANRREPGLHYNKALQLMHKTPILLSSWKDEYVNFPDDPPAFDFGGDLFQTKS